MKSKDSVFTLKVTVDKKYTIDELITDTYNLVKNPRVRNLEISIPGTDFVAKLPK